MSVFTLIELKFHHIPVEEFDSPSLQQMRELHRIVCQAQEKHEVFLFHSTALDLKFLSCKQTQSSSHVNNL